MKTRNFKVHLFLLLFVIVGLRAAPSVATPNSNFLPNLWVNQVSHGGGIPNGNAAFFKYFDPNEDSAVTRINFGNAFSGIPVELDPGEAAFASMGWFMYFIHHCEDQVVRQIVDFESPQCQVSDPFENDPNISLSQLADLPEECLAPPEADPCAVFKGPMRLDFGTSQRNAREILKNEIIQDFELDGNPVAPDVVRIKQLKYTLNAENPDESSSCSEQIYFSPLAAYFFYGYQIPAQSGGCMTKMSAVTLTPLTPGEHELVFKDIGFEFPPVTIIQH